MALFDNGHGQRRLQAVVDIVPQFDVTQRLLGIAVPQRTCRKGEGGDKVAQIVDVKVKRSAQIERIAENQMGGLHACAPLGSRMKRHAERRSFPLRIRQGLQARAPPGGP